MNRRTTEDAAGFTLLEALIATALMGTIISALATISKQWLPNWNRGFESLHRSEQLAIGLERLVGDLASAQFVTLGNESREVLFDGRSHSVTFVRTTLAPNEPPTLEIVRISQVRSEHGPILVRDRAPFAPLADRKTQISFFFRDPVVLLRSPYQLTFHYSGSDRAWQDAWQHSLQLPQAVKLTVSG